MHHRGASLYLAMMSNFSKSSRAWKERLEHWTDVHFCGFSFIAIYMYFNLGCNFSVLLLVLIGAEAEVPHLKVDKQQPMRFLRKCK